MTNTAPERPDQIADLLNDKDKLAGLFREGKFGDIIDAYTTKVMDARDGELQKQWKEQLQAGLAEWLQANRAEGLPAAYQQRAVERKMAGSTPATRALYGRHAPGRKADGLFESREEFFAAVAVATGRNPGFFDSAALRDKLGKLTEIQNAYSSEVPSQGGFLIPEILRSEILELAIEESVIRSRATVIPMNSLRVPIPFVDDTSHVSSLFGGVITYWTEEAGSLTASSAKFGRVTLDARKLTAYSDVPAELLQDAPAFAGFFDSAFPRALAFAEDVAFMTGDGSEQPLGFINCPASVQVTKETGQASSTIVWENIVKMYARMLPTSLRKAVWIAAIDTFPELATMALSVGTGGGPVWIGNFAGGSGGADTPPMSILGRPVIFTEKVPALGTTGDISFVDPSYYLIGDRMQMESASTNIYKFGQDLVSYRAIERVDGRPWLQSALTPHNNSANTLSAFVQIATR